MFPNVFSRLDVAVKDLQNYLQQNETSLDED